MLKYGSKMADPNFKPGAKTEAQSTITYNPYSLKDYRNIKNSDMNPRNRELPKGLGPTWDEKRAEAARAKEQQKKYGVSWEFMGPNQQALTQARLFCVREGVQSYYIGVTKEPVARYHEIEEGAHCRRFHQMFVLAVGKHMGQLEKVVIAGCRKSCPELCENKSGGGEGIHEESVRFLYICLRFRVRRE